MLAFVFAQRGRMARVQKLDGTRFGVSLIVVSIVGINGKLAVVKQNYR